MITVHHLDKSRSHRILWALEELGLPYEVTSYTRDPQTSRAPAALRAVHPLGKSPVVTDGPNTLIESGAILEYLAEGPGQGRLKPPAGTPEALLYRQWLHYSEGSLMTPLLLKLVFGRMRDAPAPFFVQPIKKPLAERMLKTFADPQLALHLDFVEAELGKRPWFAGDDLTMADIAMSFPLQAANSRGDGVARPNIAAFVQRIEARPAYKKAEERGGRLELL